MKKFIEELGGKSSFRKYFAFSSAKMGMFVYTRLWELTQEIPAFKVEFTNVSSISSYKGEFHFTATFDFSHCSEKELEKIVRTLIKLKLYPLW